MSERKAFEFPSSGALEFRGQKLSERVAHRLVEIITTNKLLDGTRLPVEAELQTILGVGKNTLREALRILEGWGVIEIKQGRYGGPTVRTPRPDDLREALTVQLLFASATLDDVIEARCCVEPQSAMIAATRMSTEGIASLRESVERMRTSMDNNEAFLEENKRFHADIAASTSNVVLEAFTGTLKSVMDGTVSGIEYDSSTRHAVVDAHERIVDAIEKRDPEQARHEMYEHLREAGNYWVKRGAITGSNLSWSF